MIESLLHMIRLAFATSALWTLDPSVAPSADNWAAFDDGSTLFLRTDRAPLFIGTDSTPGLLLVESEGSVLVTCRTHVDHGRTTYDRCVVAP